MENKAVVHPLCHAPKNPGSIVTPLCLCPGSSFEANPPFVEELMYQMVLHMEDLLCSTDQPLSFTVVRGCIQRHGVYG